eukprot:6344893-Alexandrium_andersonii.AAC.1
MEARRMPGLLTRKSGCPFQCSAGEFQGSAATRQGSGAGGGGTSPVSMYVAPCCGSMWSGESSGPTMNA